MYVFILYLRCEDAILGILHMGLPITTTLAGEWLNILIFYKCITSNQYMIIYAESNYQIYVM